MGNVRLNSKGSISAQGPLLSDQPSEAGGFWDGAPQYSSLPGSVPEYDVLDLNMLTWPGPVAASAEPGVGGWYAEGDGTIVIDIREAAGPRPGLRIQTDTTDNNEAIVRQNGTPWKYVSGKRMWMYGELRSGDANDGEIIFGLIPDDANADPIGTEPTTGFYFLKDEAATEFDFRCLNTSDSGADLVSGTLSDDTSIHVGFKVLASGAMEVYSGATVSGMVKKLTIAAGAAGLNTDNLQVVMGVKTGAADADYLDVLRLYVAQER